MKHYTARETEQHIICDDSVATEAALEGKYNCEAEQTFLWVDEHLSPE